MISNTTSAFYGDVWAPPFNVSMQALATDVSNPNLIWGMMIGPRGGGAVNNPADTDLWVPSYPPGLIQSAARFSRISRLPQFSSLAGAVIDDFFYNFPNRVTAKDMTAIRLALRGHTVFPNGTVDPNSTALTPHLQLMVVTYEVNMPTLNFSACGADAMSFTLHFQKENYTRFIPIIKELRQKLPKGTLLNTGLYIKNSWTSLDDPTSVKSILKDAATLFAAGLIHGTHIFAGPFFSQQNHFFNASQWAQLNILNDLKKYYYPALGGVNITVMKNGVPVAGVPLSIHYRTGNLVSLKSTNQNGFASFGGNQGAHVISYGFTGTGRILGNVAIVAGKTVHIILKL
jgi:hypothetical protein